MDRIEQITRFFATNYPQRNSDESYRPGRTWGQVHRGFAKQAIAELRCVTNRPRKAFKKLTLSDHNHYQGSN